MLFFLCWGKKNQADCRQWWQVLWCQLTEEGKPGGPGNFMEAEQCGDPSGSFWRWQPSSWSSSLSLKCLGSGFKLCCCYSIKTWFLLVLGQRFPKAAKHKVAGKGWYKNIWCLCQGEWNFPYHKHHHIHARRWRSEDESLLKQCLTFALSPFHWWSHFAFLI